MDLKELEGLTIVGTALDETTLVLTLSDGTDLCIRGNANLYNFDSSAEDGIKNRPFGVIKGRPWIVA